MIALVVSLLPTSSGEAKDAGDLRGQLQGLSSAERFRVQGLRHVDGEAAKPVPAGDAVRVLRVILEGYDYVLVNGPRGDLAEVRILGRSNPVRERGPQQHLLKSTRRGNHHELASVVVGPNGRRHPLPLTLDTGATTVVLPASLMAPLGFRPEALKAGWAGTAGGPVATWSGELRSVTVGTAEARGVAVSFIDDDRLGETGLLGMSFLGRFTLVMDDASNEIKLLAR